MFPIFHDNTGESETSKRSKFGCEGIIDFHLEGAITRAKTLKNCIHIYNSHLVFNSLNRVMLAYL